MRNTTPFRPSAPPDRSTQTIEDLTLEIALCHGEICEQISEFQEAARLLVGPDPDTVRATELLGKVRGRRSGIVAGIRGCRSGLINLQCYALAVKQDDELSDNDHWQAIGNWQVSDPATRLIDAVEAALLPTRAEQDLVFADYDDDKRGDPLFPESAKLGEDHDFLQTTAELFTI